MSSFSSLVEKYPLKDNPYVQRGSQKVFGNSTTGEHQLGREAVNLKIAAKIFKMFYENGSLRRFEFGQRVISNLVKYLDRLNIQEHPTKEQIDSIREIMDFYKGIIGSDFEVIRIGALAEYASMRACNKALRQSNIEGKVLHPSSEDDLSGGTDFWIVTERRKIAVQVKCLGLNEPMPSSLNFFNSRDEIARLDSEIEMRQNARSRSRGNKFSASAQRLLNNKPEGCLSAAIIVPSPESSYPYFNNLTGIPSESFIGEIEQSLRTNL